VDVGRHKGSKRRIQRGQQAEVLSVQTVASSHEHDSCQNTDAAHPRHDLKQVM
jgi:hypothetical protein